MRLEDLAITLRPRQGWEAIDLGFRMAMHWARPVWTTWWLVYLPLAIALLLALREHPVVATLAIWWLRPIPERFVLFVLSRRTFGARTSLVQTLGAWREILSPGLIRRLLLRPFGWARSFLDPVPALERLRGRDARRRSAVLGRRLGGHALGLALVCFLFEMATMSALMMLVELFQPAAEIGAVDTAADADGGLFAGWSIGVAAAYALAVALIGPLYVAGGFAMYLTRRTALEGWDIELSLRRAAARARARSTALPALALALLFALGPGGNEALARTQAEETPPATSEQAPSSHPARPLDTPARRAALEVMTEDVFGGWRERMRWRLPEERRDSSDNDLRWLRGIGDWLSVGLRAAAWLALAVLVLAVVWLLARRFGGQLADHAAASPPPTLFGLAITPESLPDDIVAAALAALDAGQPREAVSLLYRGALSFLVHREGMRIGEGATEGEVLRRAEPLLASDAATHFRRLLSTWVEIAYGHRTHPPQQLHALCLAHRRHFQHAGATP